jgi:hypothetical protein
MVDIAKNSIGRFSIDRVRHIEIKIYKRIQFSIRCQLLNPASFNIPIITGFLLIGPGSGRPIRNLILAEFRPIARQFCKKSSHLTNFISFRVQT